MKALIQKIFCYLLAGLVFVSSTGFGLVEHSCLMSGKERVLKSDSQSCCSARKATKVFAAQSAKASLEKEPCCTEETKYTNVDVSTSLVQAMSNLLASLCVAVVSVFSFLFNTLIEVFTASVASFHSPPLSGRALLIFIQTFLI
jgi:hypothetical protein